VIVNANDLYEEALSRLPGLVERAVKGLDPEQLHQPPAEGANTVGWLVWHLTRIQDDHLADLIGEEQIYLTEDWAPRFGLKPDPSETGYGHSPTQVQSVRPESWETLVEYYSSVHERTLSFVRGLTEADYDRIVDDAWDPPVTLAVRLVSVLNDDIQHAGQAAYVRGLL
jgi:uncharacterized damage-inducible protein DinB